MAEFDLAHFFAWARLRAYRDLEARLSADPQLDPNWTFSDIMQELLDEFRQLEKSRPDHPDEPDEPVEPDEPDEIDTKVNVPREIS